MQRYRMILFLLGIGLWAGCASSLTPLYRDYEVQPAEVQPMPTTPADAAIYDRIGRALQQAGWQRVDGQAENVVSTNSRQIRNWGIYSIEVSLDVVPLNDDYVRVYVHPYRHYFTGGRSKLGFLSKGLGRSFLPDLQTAFADEGLYPIGTHVTRDKEMTGE